MTTPTPTPIYLDNNATTCCDENVVKAMLPYFTEQFGNPSSMHSFGAKVGHAIKAARTSIQHLIGAEHDSEIIFTSGGSEGDNTAILSALKANPDRKEIITSMVEHHAVLTLCEQLEKEGYKIHYIQVDHKGNIDIEQYKRALSDKVAVVSIMWANNETGTIFPVEELAALAKPYGVLFHTDAVQAVGKMPINMAGNQIDMLSMSGHKLHGPKGIGALYLRRGARFRPLLRGGGQERGRRAGTENTPAIVGFGVAAEQAMANMEHENTYVGGLRDRLQKAILAAVPNSFVTGNPDKRLPNTLNIAFEYVEGEAILMLMNKQGIAASSGSACTSGSLEPSHVMRAMGIPYTAAHGTIRFSLSRDTTEEEVDRVAAAIPPIIAQLRKLSPYWDSANNCPAADPEKAFQPTYA